MKHQKGHFVVVRTSGTLAWVIRLFTRSQVNHAAVFVGDGRYVEARLRGARVADLAGVLHGAQPPFVLVESRFDLTSDEQDAVAKAALALVGTPYNFLDILALGFMCMGLRWSWLVNRAEREDRLICSQLVDRAYANAGLDLFTDGRPDGSVTPGDLLLYLAAGRTPIDAQSNL